MSDFFKMQTLQTILLASTNTGKVNEFKAMLEPLGIRIMTTADLGVPSLEVIEDGLTFAENALKKSQAYQRHFKMPALADDSGLMVDALHGEPGILSARYAGKQGDDAANNARLLQELKEIPLEQRTARFVCTLALTNAVGDSRTYTGECHGLIATEPAGEQGFGYDPVFYLPDKQCTLAQLQAEQKNELSHRRQALQKLLKDVSVHA